MACLQDDYHPRAEQEIQAFRARRRLAALGELFALLDGVLEDGLSNGEMPVHPVHVPQGTGLYERCASQMFGVFVVENPPAPGELPVMRLLAVDSTQAAARANAAHRV